MPDQPTTDDKRQSTSRHAEAAAAVLEWYGWHRRRLPWRAEPAAKPNPYHVWLSEIMLQQTTVATVEKRFGEFIRRWPNIRKLAGADRGEVMEAWAGLGYYARARNLHACAIEVVENHRGRFPDTESGLRSLPGIGSYTAASIAAIAFGQRAVVVDANIERVAARWEGITTPLPSAKREIRAVVDALTPGPDEVGEDGRHPAGDFAQALMDIGADVCTPPRKAAGGLTGPKCDVCPLHSTCLGRLGDPASIPARKPKGERPVRRGFAIVAEDARGRLLMRRRGDEGMLGGMLVFPGDHWADGSKDKADYPLEEDPVLADLLDAGETVEVGAKVGHVFSHFRLELTVVKVALEDGWAAPGAAESWLAIPKDELSEAALPTVVRKAARAAGYEA